MIHTKEVYYATCDKCGRVLGDDDTPTCFDDPSDLKEALNEEGWDKVRGKLVCSDCQDYLDTSDMMMEGE